MQQQTVAEAITCNGVGLHSGRPAQITIHPAEAGTGIVFVRSDLTHPVEIPVQPGSVSDAQLSTKLGRGDATVDGVEHLLAALYGLGVHNVRITVEGGEIPSMDGSAAPFAFLLRTAGLRAQSQPIEPLRLAAPVEIRQGDRWIRAEPARSFKISYRIDYSHPAIGRQVVRHFTVRPESFEREIAHARTFGFLRDADALRRAGRALGASLENAIVLDDAGVMNPDGLRYPDEFVRHKLLDLIGDLALLGTPLRAHVRVRRGGHTLHAALVGELAQLTAMELPERRAVAQAVPIRAAAGGVRS